ncbi:MAG: hypothetical protein AABX23_01815 [Nanoarchaeota archaeon]
MVMLYLPDECTGYWVGKNRFELVPSYLLQVQGRWTHKLFSLTRKDLLYELAEATTRQPVKVERVHNTISERGKAFDFRFSGLSNGIIIGPVGLNNLLWYENESKSPVKLEGIELQLHLMGDGQRFGLSHPRSGSVVVPYIPRESVPVKKIIDDECDGPIPFCGGEAEGPVPFC